MRGNHMGGVPAFFIAAFIAAPIMLVCCGGGGALLAAIIGGIGGSLLAFETIATALGAAGSWIIGLGGVAAILAGMGAFLFIHAMRRQKICDIDAKGKTI